MQITELETHYKSIRDNFNENFRLRIHRSISWLKRAEIEENEDMKFVSLWIAFNAAYAKGLSLRYGEKSSFMKFLNNLCTLDKDKKITNIIWNDSLQSIELLLENKFVFAVFWEFYNGNLPKQKYDELMDKNVDSFRKAVKHKNTAKILLFLFERLYILRNQIMHGGSTYGSSTNRDQVRDSCRILTALLPEMLQIMMKHHDQVDWGKPFYPVVKE
ncbi:hypothetical protein [Lonepinella sp. BR2919]|uniref:hypothetical protein n=1 Tax=unclassified Lonepinella TaxID=2642006 RepID=UPI003F6E0619